MFFQFQAAVRAAFRTHYEIDNASLDTTLHQLNAVYIRSAWMPRHAILRAQGNFRVNNMFFVIFIIMFFYFQKSGDWHDSVSLLLANPRVGRLRRHALVGPSRQELKYEPDYFRCFATVCKKHDVFHNVF